MRTLHFPRIPLLRALLTALSLMLPSVAGAERVKAWVVLRDKGPVAAALSGRALEDAPVHAPYLNALRTAGFEVSTALKWQNKVSGWVDDSRLGAVRALPFVRAVEEMPRKAPPVSEPAPSSGALSRRAAAKTAAQDFGVFNAVFEANGASRLRDTVAARSLRPGEGVRVAVMDDGFKLGHQAFDSLYARGGPVDQWDFVGGGPVAASRTLGVSHGAGVLSLIAGELPGVLQGLAPYARFLLYRTEDEANEGYVEEDYLAAAIERAVDSGANVINISLSYRYDFDSDPEVPYAAMDGRTRPSSIAAVGAARRGTLVVAAIGNESTDRPGQPNLTAPSDADSILAVGIANVSGARCGYSSIGPSHDGRVKPELVTAGCVVPTANPSTMAGTSNSSGTSFASPMVAGITALLVQLHRDSIGVTPQRIRRALMTSATRTGSPDNLTGYGVASAVGAHNLLRPREISGVLAWRGRTTTLPWANVTPSRARLWDVLGRERRVRVGWTPEGDLRVEPPSEGLSQGAYILRIPSGPDPAAP